MADAEIAKLRAIIASRPRATELAQMRIDSDARGKAFGLPAQGNRVKKYVTNR